jgi:hypothetical protein
VLLLLLAASLICAQDTSGKSYVMVIVNKPMTCNLVNLMNPPIEEITVCVHLNELLSIRLTCFSIDNTKKHLVLD